MQFVVTAMDHTDSHALERRLQHRDEHIAGVKQLIKGGNVLSGGAIINKQGIMIGSTLHLEFPTREALEKVLQNDPYVSGKVWDNIEIYEMKRVPME